ncbi:MAG: hypothetical protein ACAI43_04705, partial [Phycisphaerae bacterium]
MIGQEVRTTVAAGLARNCFRRNLRALGRRQIAVADPVHAAGMPEGLEWVRGRDGTLTAREVAGGWVSGSALPAHVAQRLLSKMTLGSAVACFLCPTHAQQLRYTLSRMTPSQALIAIVPDLADLRVVLACEDFAADIAAGRLWFAAGENWAETLAQLFRHNEGLPTAGQFIRTNLVDADETAPVLAAAERVLRAENERRAARVPEIFASATGATGRVTVIAPSRFRLWDDAGRALGHLARAAGWSTIDPDDVCSASPVALARAAAGSDALLLANASRADLPGGLPGSLPIVTWMTVSRAPRAGASGDAIIVADPAWRPIALAAGWLVGQISVGAWPTWENLPAVADREELVVVADTLPVVVPEFEWSSHRVLWDTIAGDIARDPFTVGRDAAAYLDQWARRAGIPPETLDRRAFVERLIQTAYAQGLVRDLHAAGLPLALFGRGWDAVPDLADLARGPIGSPAELRAATAGAAALILVWPDTGAHPIDAAGRPVLRPGAYRTSWVAAARHALAVGAKSVAPATAA